jgi:hypothetical protein
LSRYGAGDLRIHREDIAHVAIVGIGPEVLLGVNAHELDHDANPIAGAQDGSLEHRVDAEQVREVPQRPIGSLEGTDRLPGNDPQGPDAR